MGPQLLSGWHSLAFYPDSDHLTFGTASGRVETWEARTAQRVSTLGVKEGGVAASPDGRWLASGDLTVWSSKSGSRVFSLPQESGPIWFLAWSPDGERLAVGSADGGLAIWNLPKVEAQLAQIGLAWRADAQPPRPQEPQPFEPATPLERQHQIRHYLNLGRRLADVGRVAESAEAYRAALKLKPDDPVLHGELGKVLEDQARYKEAEAELNEAIQLRPEHGWFWVMRGWVYADMGQWEKASADFVKATECKEPHEEGLYCRAMLHLRNGNMGGYREICLDMLRRFGTGATWTCTLSPNSGVDPAHIVRLAEKILANSARNH